MKSMESIGGVGFGLYHPKEDTKEGSRRMKIMINKRVKNCLDSIFFSTP